MKIFIYLFIAMISLNTLTAQETIVPLKDHGVFDEDANTTYYFKDVNNDLIKFTGTWMYNSGNIQFTAKIYKTGHIQNGTGDYYDEIYVKVRLVNNGQVVYDNLNEINYDSDISGSNLMYNNVRKISLTYVEPGLSVRAIGLARLNLEYIPCSGNGCEQLIWHNTYLKETAEEPWPYAIPTQMVLTRQ